MLVFGGVVFQPSVFGELLIFEEVFDKHLYCPKYPDPSKVPILRTRTPAIQVQTLPVEGPWGSLGWDKRLNVHRTIHNCLAGFQSRVASPRFRAMILTR